MIVQIQLSKILGTISQLIEEWFSINCDYIKEKYDKVAIFHLKNETISEIKVKLKKYHGNGIPIIEL